MLWGFEKHDYTIMEINWRERLYCAYYYKGLSNNDAHWWFIYRIILMRIHVSYLVTAKEKTLRHVENRSLKRAYCILVLINLYTMKDDQIDNDISTMKGINRISFQKFKTVDIWINCIHFFICVISSSMCPYINMIRKTKHWCIWQYI